MAPADTLPENTTPLDSSALQSLSIGLGPEWATSATPRPPSAPKNFRDDDRGFRDFGDRRPGRGGNSDRRQGGGFSGAPDGPRRDGGFSNGNDRGPRRDRGFGRGDRSPRREGGFSGGPRRGGFGGGNDRSPRRDFGGERGDDGFPRSDFPPRGQSFAPVVDVALYPEDKPFNVLIKAIKASLRTYDLFEIALLILEKGDRFVVACRSPDSERNPDAYLYQSVPDSLPFLSESDAVAHVVQRHIDLFFTSETVTVEPPKGSFQMVSKCGFTGEILGPPNYHGYQQTLREHHAARLARVPFDRFTSRIEAVRDKEEIDKWLQSKTQVTRYTLKGTAEGAAPVQFDSLDAARNYLLANLKDRLVRATKQLRFSGKDIATLPIGPLRSAIDNEVARQRRFPLDFANFLRGRLRKLGLVLYKRGSKDITVVSAVERKFRAPGSVFADSIQRVFDFIEQRPFVKAADFPEKFLGLAPEDVEGRVQRSEECVQKEGGEITPAPEAATSADAPTSGEAVAAAPVPDSAIVPPASGEAAEPVDTETTPVVVTKGETAVASADVPVVDTDAAAASAPDCAAESLASDGVPAVAEEVVALAEVAPAPESPTPAPEKAPVAQEPRKGKTYDLSNPIVRELLNNLRWLVSEGYVTEFSDGRLFANPVRAAMPSRNAPSTAGILADAAATTPASFVPRQSKKSSTRDRRRRGGVNLADVALKAEESSAPEVPPAESSEPETTVPEVSLPE